MVDYAPLIHPTDLQSLALPDGQNTQVAGQSARAKIFHFTEIRLWRIQASPHPGQRGVSRSSRNVGWAAVDAGSIGAMGIAGRATVSEDPRAHDRCDPRTAKSCGPGARRLAPSLAVMWRPDRARTSAICKATGAIVHRSPGRARHKPSNHCAGKAGCLASPVCRCAASCSATFAQWTAGVSRHPVFPAPSDNRG
ncbi:hypothetical protein FHR88_001028 [Bradyrhizobium betae]|nr:hypothetical protein [Bradyrhizobium betae]